MILTLKPINNFDIIKISIISQKSQQILYNAHQNSSRFLKTEKMILKKMIKTNYCDGPNIVKSSLYNFLRIKERGKKLIRTKCGQQSIKLFTIWSFPEKLIPDLEAQTWRIYSDSYQDYKTIVIKAE